MATAGYIGSAQFGWPAGSVGSAQFAGPAGSVGSAHLAGPENRRKIVGKSQELVRKIVRKS